jgi:hypothetical protein
MIRARYATAVVHDLKAFPERWPSVPNWLKGEVKRMGAEWIKRYGAKPKRFKPKITLLRDRLAQRGIEARSGKIIEPRRSR